MASVTIGDSFGSKFWMIGSSMFGGSCRRMRATFAATSCRAAWMSTPRLNCRRTIEVPWLDVLVTSYVPATVFTASSIGRETCRSIVCGDAPG